MTRKVAELDEVVHLTTRRVWATLTAVLVLFGALVTWGLLARVESTVELDGMLVAGAGPTLVTAPAAATVVSSPQVGSAVQAGADLIVLDVAGERRVVTSPVAGAVSSVAVRPGSPVSGGEVLATVEPAGARLGAVLLLDAANMATVPTGTKVRGAGLSGRVTAVEPYPVRADDLAARFGQRSLPGDGQRLVRAVHVDLGLPARAGATLTPVRLDLVLGERRPADLLWHGGA
ncbi:HlyD family efflux transporter periplasmic adaptor subunit [Phytohabitans sp. ZYX-F-186]|uniref:HlyD family efflux transporter periplasmic adaptor subunit n=1 Tax=Phytohabitans maris TaxID=3071409 RepID=A0ABU0ZAT8_9ACTN|nr:HlyD family efflux transporter periplasmic adaptor subunit [Phytohabitans sp. ZYX-F-186]MDQ7904154.1 HlyD family efflux transporter periplasmic adaptor subunit [Phytohabitans sp. ZYX-F-186]